jgi:hypothetical protein
MRARVYNPICPICPLSGSDTPKGVKSKVLPFPTMNLFAQIL